MSDSKKAKGGATLHLPELARPGGVSQGASLAGPWEPPLVSAVLIFGDPRRLKLARSAVNQFLRQTYLKKQLVVVNATDKPVTTVLHPAIKEVNVPAGPLGALRNQGLDAADGSWIVNWDDDDHNDPHRMACTVAHRREGSAVLLACQVRCNVRTGAAYLHHVAEGIPATLFHPRGPARYPDIDRGEVDAFWKENWEPRTQIFPNYQFPATVLSIAIHHGSNVLPVEEFMVGHAGPEHAGRWDLGGEETDYLRRVLAAHGFETTIRDDANAGGVMAVDPRLAKTDFV